MGGTIDASIEGSGDERAVAGTLLNDATAPISNSLAVEISLRLAARRPEIEAAALTRVYSIAEPIETADPEYTAGLRSAVAAALDYGLAAMCGSAEQAPPVPTTLLSQARLAARNGVSVDTVLRRYLAGFGLFGDFLIEEVDGVAASGGGALKQLLRTQSVVFDGLIAAVSEAYAREAEARPRPVKERRAQRVRRLLAGELLDAPDLAYDLDLHHLGAVATGPGAPAAIEALAAALDCRLLLVQPQPDTAWAWLGSHSRFDVERLERIRTWPWPGHGSVAVGEPKPGLAGWRQTHRQAKVALPVALRGSERFARYGDVALLGALCDDDLLATSLRELFLAPLEEDAGEGASLRETARAYLSASQQVSSAAAVLGVNRHTVTSRLRTIEKRLGRPLESCLAEFDIALRLAELDMSSS